MLEAKYNQVMGFTVQFRIKYNNKKINIREGLVLNSLKWLELTIIEQKVNLRLRNTADTNSQTQR